MSIGAIIFSRYASERLPGKALLDISGRCLLGRVIDRTKFIEGIDHIIVATSSNEEDDVIASFVKKEEVDLFRGSLDDVAARALATCDFYGLRKFARICGDRPFFDPNLVSSLINIHNESDLDVVTTIFPRTYPPGLTGEVVSVDALRQAIKVMTEREDKEHLTRYFYQNPTKFKIKNISPSSNLDLKGLNLCVDDENSLVRAEWIASNLIKNNDTHSNMDEIISLARKWERLGSKS